jgi:hypothetical protein
MITPQVPMSNNRYLALTVLVEALGTAKTRQTACPVNGTVVWIGSVLDVAVDGDNVITAAINGTAITGASVTHPSSGSAAGEVKQCKPTAANSVKRGDALQALTDGGGTAGQSRVTFLIEQA